MYQKDTSRLEQFRQTIKGFADADIQNRMQSIEMMRQNRENEAIGQIMENFRSSAAQNPTGEDAYVNAYSNLLRLNSPKAQQAAKFLSDIRPKPVEWSRGDVLEGEGGTYSLTALNPTTGKYAVQPTDVRVKTKPVNLDPFDAFMRGYKLDTPEDYQKMVVDWTSLQQGETKRHNVVMEGQGEKRIAIQDKYYNIRQNADKRWRKSGEGINPETGNKAILYIDPQTNERYMIDTGLKPTSGKRSSGINLGGNKEPQPSTGAATKVDGATKKPDKDADPLGIL